MKIVNAKEFEVENIVEYIRNKKYGDKITFEELQPITNYNLKDEYELYKFKSSLMSKVKNILIRYGYVLKTVRFIGYYILKPNQISSYTYRTYIIKPLKHFERAEIILNNAQTNNLKRKEFIKHQLTLQLDQELINITNKTINSEQYQSLKD